MSGLTQESDLRGPEHQAELDDFTTEDQLVKQIATLTSENQHLQKYGSFLLRFAHDSVRMLTASVFPHQHRASTRNFGYTRHGILTFQ